MRESRTYGSGRGACHEMHVPTATAARVHTDYGPWASATSPSAPGSPWRGFAERLIGSIQRECVDHVVVLGEAHLRRILTKYSAYYNELRIHRSLDKDAPIHRAIQHAGASYLRPSSADFITIIVESNFRYRQLPAASPERVCRTFPCRAESSGEGQRPVFPRGTNIRRDRSVQCRERLGGTLALLPSGGSVNGGGNPQMNFFDLTRFECLFRVGVGWCNLQKAALKRDVPSFPFG